MINRNWKIYNNNHYYYIVGNFSFGSCTKFKSHTIIEFIENAVEHSRSGRYLFFLHRRPVLGPMRVQLLHPVSRFKQTQSLQHMCRYDFYKNLLIFIFTYALSFSCRFVILKLVRRDLIPSLPLPRRIIDYLSTKHYYSEQFIESDENSGSNHESPQPQAQSQTIIEDTRQSWNLFVLGEQIHVCLVSHWNIYIAIIKYWEKTITSRTSHPSQHSTNI